MAIAMQYGNGRNGLLNVGMSMTLLWTNVDDESAFAAQTLSLNIGGYDAVLIKFKLATNVSTYANTIGFVGERTTLYSSNASTTSYTYKRYATITTSDITFSTGYRGATAGTSYAIPCEVYGIKRGGSSGGSSSSGSGGGGGGTGTLTQVTFDGTVYTDDGTGNVTLAESDPVFTASPAHTITSTDITDWNAKQDALTAGDGIDITTSVISNTQGIEYIVGTQAAATNAWTGVSKDSSLKTGKIIAYKLPYAGTSSAATLNLTMADGTTTGAIALRRTGSSTVTTHFAVNNVIVLVYDGTYWRVSAYYDSDSNTVPTGYCTTAAATAAKSATNTYGYRDDATYFPCLFRYANTANDATLAIGTYATTALPIYVNGARTSSSNTFGAGVILFLYYNNAYYCYNDGRLPIVINGSVTSVQDQFALYAPTASLATVATSGDYSDLSNTPILATVATSGSYSDLSNTPSLATVATSGDYSDLSNTPALATVATSGDYNDLSNKPTIPTVPTNVSAFNNDAGYLTSYTETDPVFTASAAHGITSTDITAWNTISSSAVKTALLDCFKNVAWINGDGRSYYNALATALGEFYPGYTFYDYITLTLNLGQGLGNANVIITDIALSSEYEISTSLYYSSNAIGGAQCVMGTRDAYTTKQFGIFVTANTGKLGYWYGNTDTVTAINAIQIGSLNTIVFKPVGKSETYPNNAVIVLNGAEYNTTSTATGQTWKSWLGFFGYARSATEATAQSYNSDRICETIVKNANDKIIHDLRPAYNGTYYGLLDTITGKFYYNSNNSYYTCGNF